MSVTIRLSRIGKTGSPAFKIVAANTRDKADGKAIEILGHYNPSHNPPLFKIDKKAFEAWKKNGAMVSTAVQELVEDKYEFKPYTRQNEAKEDEGKEASSEEAATETETEKASGEVVEAEAQVETEEAAPEAVEEAPAEVPDAE